MRTSSNPPPSPTEVISEANQAISELVFEPTDAQRRFKIKFWASVSDVMGIDKSTLNPEIIRQYAPGAPIQKWWPVQGFREWFLNVDEQRQKLEYLFDLALDAARDIITNDDPKTQSARVQMIKSVAELANKLPQRNLPQSGGMSKIIEGMDKAELALLLEKNGVKLDLKASKSKTIDIKAEELPVENHQFKLEDL